MRRDGAQGSSRKRGRPPDAPRPNPFTLKLSKGNGLGRQVPCLCSPYVQYPNAIAHPVPAGER